MSEIDGAALDRWITGNYGEDQYRGSEICDDCEFMTDDPKYPILSCCKNKCPCECIGDAKEAAEEAAAEQRRDMRNAYGEQTD